MSSNFQERSYGQESFLVKFLFGFDCNDILKHNSVLPEHFLTGNFCHSVTDFRTEICHLK